MSAIKQAKSANPAPAFPLVSLAMPKNPTMAANSKSIIPQPHPRVLKRLRSLNQIAPQDGQVLNPWRTSPPQYAQVPPWSFTNHLQQLVFKSRADSTINQS